MPEDIVQEVAKEQAWGLLPPNPAVPNVRAKSMQEAQQKIAFFMNWRTWPAAAKVGVVAPKEAE